MTTDSVPHLLATPNGPFVTTTPVVLRTATEVMSEHGEPMTWSFGPPTRVDVDTALCRCGRSDEKPFCDGTHAEADWRSTDTVSSASADERTLRLAGTGVTLLDDESLCMHAGLCGTARTSVWSMLEETDDSEVRGSMIRMTLGCPSGRLTAEVDGARIEPALPAEVHVVPGGPLWLTGGVAVTVEGHDTLEAANRRTLCRCGASGSMPLCDGTHGEIDFDAGGLGR